MNNIPHEVWPENTLALLRDPYRFISRRCQAHQSDVFQARIMLEKAICMTGREAAELFYDNERFMRQDATPAALMKTLFGVGGVQGLDGERHRRRKAMFMSLMDPSAVTRLADILTNQLNAYARLWSSSNSSKPIVIYDQLHEILTRTACKWAGLPLPGTEVVRRTRQLRALFDYAGSKTLKHWGARRARHQAEHWAAGLIEEIRAGRLKPYTGSAAAVIASHTASDGDRLDSRIAAVELLNVLRPIVAISVYVTFVVLALHRYPQCRDRLLDTNDRSYVLWFVQEVRRYYPFFPMVAARVRDEFQWRGYPFTKRAMGSVSQNGDVRIH